MFKEYLMLAVVTLMAFICVTLFTFPHWFKLNTVFVFAQIVSLRALLGIAFTVLGTSILVVAFITDWSGKTALIWVAVIFLLGAIINASILSHRGTSLQSAIEYTSEEQVATVFAWNIQNSQVPAEEIARHILETDATFVSLPEAKIVLGKEVVKRLAEQGKHMELFPGEAGDKDYTLVLVDKRFGEYHMVEQIGRTGLATVIVAPVQEDSTLPVFLGVHTMSPSAYQRMKYWREDIDWIEQQCKNYPNAIMAGDFNQTVDHWHGALLECTDFASVTRQAGLGTWPSSLPQTLGAQIDHIISTNPNIEVTEFRVIETKSNSDHRPVVGKFLLTSQH